MIRSATYRSTGIVPLLLRNGRLANPLDPFTKAIKEITGKKKKTDADYEEIARLEYFGALYMDDDGPILPNAFIHGAIVSGAKATKQGNTAKAGIVVTAHARLDYDGPRTAEELWEARDQGFCNIAPVVVNKRRVMRYRPQFFPWAATIHLEYDDAMLDIAELTSWLVTSGVRGWGDWRPLYGRCNVTKLKE